MDTRNVPSETKTFRPSARRVLLWGVVIGFIVSVFMIFLALKAGPNERPKVMVVSVCILPFTIVSMYVRFLINSSAKIEISPTGITNTKLFGKAYPILWDEVTSVNHELFRSQETCTIKASTKHRIYFTEEGLKANEWQEICNLIEHYTADKQ